MTEEKKHYTEDEAIAAVVEVLKEKHPYLIDVMEEVKKSPNGVVNLSIRVYNGYVTDLVNTTVTKRTYKPPKA